MTWGSRVLGGISTQYESYWGRKAEVLEDPLFASTASDLGFRRSQGPPLPPPHGRATESAGGSSRSGSAASGGSRRSVSGGGSVHGGVHGSMSDRAPFSKRRSRAYAQWSLSSAGLCSPRGVGGLEMPGRGRLKIHLPPPKPPRPPPTPRIPYITKRIHEKNGELARRVAAEVVRPQHGIRLIRPPRLPSARCPHRYPAALMRLFPARRAGRQRPSSWTGWT